MRDGIYEFGDIFGCSDGEYWVEKFNEKMRTLGVIPVHMSAGNHGYWIDDKREPTEMNLSEPPITTSWFIETNKVRPQIKPEDNPEAPETTTNLG